MPSSTTPGSPSVAYAQFLHRRRWPSPSLDRSALPNTPSSASDGTVISWFPGSLSLRPVELLAPLADLTGYFSQPSRAFTSGLSTGQSSFPPPDIATVATEQVPPVGLSPLEQQLASLHLGLHRTALSSAPPRRFIPAHLLVAQGDHRIDTHRTPSGKVAREQRHSDPQASRHREGQRIDGTEARKEARQ